jgi:beta-glucosidase-like glycosyl hydrolase
MEMKAVSARYPVPDAATDAIAAGCDTVLICSGNTELQAAALETIVHAVEDERLPYARVENAIARQRQMKERFLGEAVGQARTEHVPLSGRALRALLGRDSHAAVAEEMARYL